MATKLTKGQKWLQANAPRFVARGSRVWDKLKGRFVPTNGLSATKSAAELNDHYEKRVTGPRP